METKQDIVVPQSQANSKPNPTPQWYTATPYEPLQAGQIRLLRVQPASGSTELSLRCSLSTYDLSAAPPFTALSYTWGPSHRDIDKLRLTKSSDTCDIECDGKQGRVGENLYDFLCLCAHETSHGLQGHLWIDALSINQGDMQERCEQVKLMSSIYKTATKVVVWLGPEDRSTAKATDLMNGMLRLEPWEQKKLYPADVKIDHANSLLNLSSWQALAEFFGREWFYRAWIIQEVVLAQSVTLLCGQHAMSWNDLRRFSHFLATSSWTMLLKQSADPNLTYNSGHNTPARLAAAQKTWLSDDDDKFLYALVRARSSNSENPRDKVYSQLGLGDVDILPDYRVSVADVYITAAKYILAQSKSLLLLTCVEGSDFQAVPGLPSWVPDWSVTQCLGLRMTGYKDFHAALDRPKRQALSVDDSGKHILGIEATELDEIVEVCETKPELRDKLHASKFWEMLSKLSTSYAAVSVPKQSREEAVWRTLMTNRGGLKYPASTEPFLSSFRDWVLWRYVVASECPSTFPVPSSTDDHLFPTKAEIQNAREQSHTNPTYLTDLARRASLYDVHYSHAKLLRPFRTRKGYFGIGTQCLRAGDSAWVVPGCPVPLILRRIADGEGYRLVGGSYIHGFMNGELLQREGLEFKMVELQ